MFAAKGDRDRDHAHRRKRHGYGVGPSLAGWLGDHLVDQSRADGIQKALSIEAGFYLLCAIPILLAVVSYRNDIAEVDADLGAEADVA